jgi:hypothetical protein
MSGVKSELAVGMGWNTRAAAKAALKRISKMTYRQIVNDRSSGAPF